MASEKQYLSLYEQQKALICAGSCAPMNNRREEAAALLTAKGLPTAKTERYKYTDVEAAFAPDFGLNLKRIPLEIDPYETYRCTIEHLGAWNYYVVNDTVAPASHDSAALPQGIIVDSLVNVAAKRPELLEKFYHQAAGRSYDGVTTLNTLLAQDGLLIYIPSGVEAERAVQIVNVSASTIDFMSNRRVLIVLEENAKATVLFCDHALEGRHYLTTEVVEVFAEQGAELDIYAVEETDVVNTRFCNVYIEQASKSKVTYSGMTLHNGVSRNTVNVRLNGEQAEVNTYGAVVADGKERVDNNLLIDHIGEGCTSEMLYKYVLDDNAVGAFAGKVLVEPGAQHTQSQQTNDNLCVSQHARAFAQPMLEIYADDVKCNHGSTVGKLDANALFYMQQRGVPEKEASLLLQHAFINDVLQRIKMETLRDRLSYLIEQRFRGNSIHCKGCRMVDYCRK